MYRGCVQVRKGFARVPRPSSGDEQRGREVDNLRLPISCNTCRIQYFIYLIMHGIGRRRSVCIIEFSTVVTYVWRTCTVCLMASNNHKTQQDCCFKDASRPETGTQSFAVDYQIITCCFMYLLNVKSLTFLSFLSRRLRWTTHSTILSY